MAALSLALAAVLVLAFLVLKEQAMAFPALGPGPVIEVLGPAGGKGSGKPLARISVSNDGRIGLEPGKDEKLNFLLRFTLAQARAAGALPLSTEVMRSVEGRQGRAAGSDSARPGDPRYHWAILDHLRRRGFECVLGREAR